MTFTNSATLYTKYLKIQAAKIDLETAGEKAEDIIFRMANAVYENGYLRKEDLPANFQNHCKNKRENYQS